MEKNIFLILIFINFFQNVNCKSSEFKNGCDPTSKTFLAYMIVKIATDDKSSYCNSGSVLPSSGTSSPTIQTITVVATPTFSIPAGNYLTPQNISISTTTQGSNIYFTTVGSTPTNSSTLFSTAIHIYYLAGLTIKAIATKTGFIDSAVLTGVFSYPPLRTGATTSYAAGDDFNNIASGVPMSYTGPTQHPTYTSDYTTRDNATGLVWKTCSQGLSGAACGSGTISTGTWTIAGTNCTALNTANSGNGYAGIITWRLPSKIELETILDFTPSPKINSSAFPVTTADYYWSSTTNSQNGLNAWAYNFVDGSSGGSINKTTSYYYRCVSGVQKSATQNLTDNGDGTVKDNSTGFFWQKCSKGLSGVSCASGSIDLIINFANSISYCNGLSLASKTWRVPNQKELSSIVDLSLTVAPVINTTFFPNTSATGYWGSTTFSGGITYGYMINFADSQSTYPMKTSGNSIRCVSGP